MNKQNISKKKITKTIYDSVNHARHPVTGSPTRLSTSGQISYTGWSFRVGMQIITAVVLVVAVVVVVVVVVALADAAG